MTILIYGAAGYTGALVARYARDAGVRPVVAGRDGAAVRAVAAELGLPARVFALDALDAGLDGITAVLNAAGSFGTTGPPLLDACLARGVHYVDLAGEVPAVEAVARRHDAALAAGVMMLPGAGFGVVATDIAAARAAAAVDGAVELEIAFRTVGGVSRGTAAGLLPTLHHAGVTRIDGRLVPATPGSRSLSVDFGDGRPRTVVLNPWRADLVTAAYSTGARTVTTYQDLPAPLRLLMRPAPRLVGALDSSLWQGLLRRTVRLLPPGPSRRGLASGHVEVWARARDGAGARAEVRLHGPEAYAFTARSAVAVLHRIEGGDAPTGFRTPVTAYGTALASDIEGVEIDVRPTR